MSNAVLEALGINPENLDIETSVVTAFTPDQEKPTRFSEGLLQNLYKIANDKSLGLCSHLKSTSDALVYSIGNSLLVNSNEPNFHLKYPIIDLCIYGGAFYLLHKELLVAYDLHTHQEIFSIALTETFKKIRISEFGKEIILIGGKKLMRIEEKVKMNLIDYEKEITSIDFIIDCSDLIAVVLNYEELLVLNYITNETVSEQSNENKIDEICSVNDSVILLFSQELALIKVYDFADKVTLYSILFTSKTPKKMVYCEETEQLIILNKNSSKVVIMTMSSKGYVSKYVIFGLNCPASDIQIAIVENTLKNQPLYEGNARYILYLTHEETVDAYSLEIISTKTLDFRYGKEPQPLQIRDDKLSSEDLSPQKKYSQIIASLNPFTQISVSNISLKTEERKEIKREELRPLSFEQKINPASSSVPFLVQEPSIKVVNRNPVKHPPINKSIDSSLNESENSVQKIIPGNLLRISDLKTEFESLSSKVAEMVSSGHISKQIISAFSNLEPKLKERIKADTNSAIEALLASPIEKIAIDNLRPLENSLRLGLEQMESKQSELNEQLISIAVKIGMSPQTTTPESFVELIRNRNTSKIKQFIEKSDAKKVVNQEISEDDCFDLGFILIEMIPDCKKASEFLEEICTRISSLSSKFGSFYFEIEKCTGVGFKKSIEILESKF